MVYWYAKQQSSFLWLDLRKIYLVILASVLLRLSLLPLGEEASPPVVWTMMLILWHVFITSEDLDIAPSSSTFMNATVLSWFINVLTRIFRMSRGGCLLLDENPKGYEVAEHIATKVEVNLRILSTLKNAKFIWIMNPGANVETSVVGPLGILVALVKRQIGQLKFPLIQLLMYQNLSLDSCFKWILRLSMLKASMNLPQLSWLYTLPIHNPLDYHPEESVHLLTSYNFLSPHG